MPSTYSPRLRFELQATGENRSTWGTKANNVFRRVEDSIAGYSTISVANTNYTLTVQNGTEDEAREAVINITGTWTAARTITVPDVEKMYIMRNATTGGFAMTVANSSTSVSVTNGEVALIITDGVNIQKWGNKEQLPLAGGTMTGVLNMGSQKITSLANGTAATDAVNFSQLSQAVPIGTMFDYGGSVAPTNYLLCFGQAISRTTYADLFAVIGTTFGAGNGSTTFNVPDFRGRVSVGTDNMGGSAANRVTTAGSGINGAAAGQSGGSQNTSLITGNIPSHNHTFSDTSSSAGGHSHTFSDTTSSAGSHNHTFSDTTSSGGVHAHTFNFISSSSIAALPLTSGGESFGEAVRTGGTPRSGTISINDSSSHTHTVSGTTSTAAAHTHSVSGTTSTVSGHTHSVSGTTSSTGSGDAFPNMQPSLIVNKIIKVL